MKYLKQFAVIVTISLMGELLNYILPLPVPASIYGLVIMFFCLSLKIIKVSDVKETSAFLIGMLQLMFIPAGVGLIASWDIVQKNFLALSVLIVASTLLVFLVSGRVTQHFLSRKEGM